MADRTGVPVAAATWNPVTGCDRLSPGCRRCYALAFARRLAGRYGYPRETPFAVTYHPDRLDRPRRWKAPRTVFTCSMGDLFHAEVPDEIVARVFAVMADTRRHTYMVLTKRPSRMARWLDRAPEPLLRRAMENVWLGVSAEDQRRAGERLPPLIAAWPGRRIACLEPLLGRVDPGRWLPDLDWVIAGGETGPGGREADPDHVRLVRDRCAAAGVPFFFKQWGGRSGKARGNALDGDRWEQLGDYRAVGRGG
jgi:protein gp37